MGSAESEALEGSTQHISICIGAETQQRSVASMLKYKHPKP